MKNEATYKVRKVENQRVWRIEKNGEVLVARNGVPLSFYSQCCALREMERFSKGFRTS